MVDIRALREQLSQEDTRKEQRGTQSDNASYPFWNIPDNSQATIRLLPDADANNVAFWRERGVINLEFAGIKGEQSNGKPVTVVVPSMSMFTGKKSDCPILEATKDLWKGSDTEKEIARKYYIKRSYLFQGFVVSSSLKEENVPENPIRRFTMGPSLFKIIRDSVMDVDRENPVDYDLGYDFRLIKNKQGTFANYDSSQFGIKSRSLSESERAALDQYGLFNLSEFLPKRPDDKQLSIIQQMFEDSYAGLPYDPDKYAKYYKPIGFQTGEKKNTSDETATESTSTVSETVVETKPVPVQTTVAPVATTAPASGPQTTTTSSAAAALEALRAKKAQQNS